METFSTETLSMEILSTETLSKEILSKEILSVFPRFWALGGFNQCELLES